MRRLKSIFIIFFIAASALASCSKIHQFPEPGKEIDPTDVTTRINVTCRVQLSGMDIVTKSSMSNLNLSDSAAYYDRRFFIRIYANEYSDELVDSQTIIREVADVSPLLVETKLHTRKYKLVIWMDYVKKGTVTDLYYLTSNGEALNAIHQPSPDKYKGGSDFKDAQTFLSDIDLTHYAGQWYADIEIQAPLQRPVAKITFLANDLAEYAAHIGYTGSLKNLADDLSLEFSYDGYYPSGFNAQTGRLNDSQVGYGFNSWASYPYTLEEVDYTRVGFDYVLVNGESSSVTVSVKIKSKSSGQFINEVNNVVVPITRDRETVLIYKFLTKESVPGIGIDPGFDGEFNIYV